MVSIPPQLRAFSARHQAEAEAASPTVAITVGLGLALAAMLPILTVAVPIMADYPNHLARMHILAVLGHDQLLARFYEIDWRLVPNLAVDAIVPLLARLIGVYAAGKVFVLLIAAMTVSGTFALYRAIWGRHGAWPLTAFLFLYNQIFLYGFLNYLFAAALALWGAAAWVWLRDRNAVLRTAVSAGFVLALFASHMVGVGLYGLALLSYEVWRVWQQPASRCIVRDGATFLLPFLLIVPLALDSPTAGYANQTVWTFWPEKLKGLYFLVGSYSIPLDVLYGAVLLAGLAWGVARGNLRLHPVARFFLPLAALTYLAVPTILAGASIIGTRLPASLVFFAVAFSNWQPRSVAGAHRFIAGLATVVLLRLLMIGAYWQSYEHVVAAFMRSFEQIAPGSRVLVASNLDGAPRIAQVPVDHMAALVSIERSAMESRLFSHPGKQPLGVRAPYRATASEDGDPLPIDHLVAADAGHAGSAAGVMPTGQKEQVYWSDWRQAYDYLYVLFTPDGYQPPLDRLQPLFRADSFALFKIEK